MEVVALPLEDVAAGWTIVESDVVGVVEAVVAEVCVGAGAAEDASVGSVFENATCAATGTLEVASV